ncbi:MAG TPA: hypothetical protein VM143_17295 [Acidimicrobiales bacterium]|nr:hypothetical protein [Acidimicrobiales bacterium]
MTDIVIRVPEPVAETLATLSSAVGGGVVLVGGWAVQCRLRMARRQIRPTSDLDVILGPATRPARSALEAASAIQDDPEHPCRISGLPLLVDLLAERPDAAVVGADDTVTDHDGLRLLVPPFASLLARATEPVRLEGEPSQVIVCLPLAGALFAGKTANIGLEHRPAEKVASDGEDAVRLVEAFGALALAHDLRQATPGERRDVVARLEQIGGSALAAQARVSGYDADPGRIRVVVDELLRALRR